jgi:MFS family permease
MTSSTSSPKASRIAWTQVVLASVLMLATLPGRTQGLGLVTEPLLKDLQLDRVVYANMNLWATLLGALFCLPIGWAIDRIGLRWITSAITLSLGLVVWRISSLAGSGMMLLGLLIATRALGQSALSVCSITTVGKWFSKRAGMAMGVYSVLLSVLFAVAFVAVGYVVTKHGWRAAWSGIAWALIFAITPLVVLALREPLNWRADSVAEETANDFTLPLALRTSAFWLFAGAAASFNLVSSGLGLFNEAVLAERQHFALVDWPIRVWLAGDTQELPVAHPCGPGSLRHRARGHSVRSQLLAPLDCRRSSRNLRWHDHRYLLLCVERPLRAAPSGPHSGCRADADRDFFCARPGAVRKVL